MKPKGFTTSLIHSGCVTLLFLLTGFIVASFSQTPGYNSVYFTSNNTGYVVGMSASGPTLIQKTTDGGVSWITQTSGQQNPMHSVFFLDSAIGWTIGWSPILKTVNGGATWSALGAGNNINPYNSLNFTDADTGWVVGYGSTVMKTMDGGITWTQQTNGLSAQSDDFQQIQFINTHLGWIATGSSIILNTANGGSTWTEQTTGSNASLLSIRFVNQNVGWTVGDSGTILKTVNGGTTWNRQTSGTTVSLRSVYFCDTSTGWAVGNGGTILKTVDGGVHWNQQSSITTNTLNSVFLLNATTGWIVGSGIILKISSGTAGPVPIREGNDIAPDLFSLRNNVLRYGLTHNSNTHLVLRTMDGRIQATLLDGVQSPGQYLLNISPLGLPPGTYIIDFTNGFLGQKTDILMVKP